MSKTATPTAPKEDPGRAIPVAPPAAEFANDKLGYEPPSQGSVEDTPSLEAQYAIPEDTETADVAEPAVEGASEPTEELTTPPEPVEPETLSREDFAQFGISREEASKLDKAGVLSTFLDSFDKALVTQTKASREASATAQPEPAKAAIPAQPATPPEGFKGLDLDPAVWTEEFVSQMKGLDGHYRNEIATLKQTVAALLQEREQSRAEAFISNVDSWIDQLGEEYVPVFGKGNVRTIAKGSPEHAKRSELVQIMDILTDGLQRRGFPVPSEKELFTRAVRQVAGDRAESIARKKVEAQTRNTKGQFVARPSQREGKPLTGREKAEARVAQFFKEKGLE
jgi:hypothetical protein